MEKPSGVLFINESLCTLYLGGKNNNRAEACQCQDHVQTHHAVVSGGRDVGAAGELGNDQCLEILREPHHFSTGFVKEDSAAILAAPMCLDTFFCIGSRDRFNPNNGMLLGNSGRPAGIRAVGVTGIAADRTLIVVFLETAATLGVVRCVLFAGSVLLDTAIPIDNLALCIALLFADGTHIVVILDAAATGSIVSGLLLTDCVLFITCEVFQLFALRVDCPHTVDTCVIIFLVTAGAGSKISFTSVGAGSMDAGALFRSNDVTFCIYSLTAADTGGISFLEAAHAFGVVGIMHIAGGVNASTGSPGDSFALSVCTIFTDSTEIVVFLETTVTFGVIGLEQLGAGGMLTGGFFPFNQFAFCINCGVATFTDIVIGFITAVAYGIICLAQLGTGNMETVAALPGGFCAFCSDCPFAVYTSIVIFLEATGAGIVVSCKLFSTGSMDAGAFLPVGICTLCGNGHFAVNAVSVRFSVTACTLGVVSLIPFSTGGVDIGAFLPFCVIAFGVKAVSACIAYKEVLDETTVALHIICGFLFAQCVVTITFKTGNQITVGITRSITDFTAVVIFFETTVAG